jgi:RNA recognition motif-containing protein
MKGIRVNKRLYVGNLEYSTTDSDLEELFSGEGKVVYAKVIRSLDGKSKGFGFVEMDTPEEAARAIEKLDQESFKERKIVVNEAKPQKNRGFGENTRRSNYRNAPRDDLNYKLKKIRRKSR